MFRTLIFAATMIVALSSHAYGESYPIVDTGQEACFNKSRQIACPEPGQSFNGQDAQFKGNKARYLDNGDGTVTDLVTGLMWVRERGMKMSWNAAVDGAKECRVGGYDDWRAPTIKELYSLINFNGWGQPTEQNAIPYLDTRYFDFEYGDTRRGERLIDCQDWSATQYVSTTMGGSATAFGVNFADGRIKGYPINGRGKQGRKYMRYVRGNPLYGKNSFEANGSTVMDKATGLTWQKRDSGTPMNWESALSYCDNLNLGGHKDWRLPNAKELQSIVDYTRSPQTSRSAAIDPKFMVSDPESYFWTSTTHLDGPKPDRAVYVAFGRAMGYFAPPRSNASKRFLDVHGAGAQRSDPKSGDPSRFSQGHGPQGDDIRIDNYVRCVRGGTAVYYQPLFKRIPTWKGGGNPGSYGSNTRQQDFNMPRHGGQQGMSMQVGGRGPQGGGRQGGGRMGPPPEAYEACSGVSNSGECSFQSPHGTVTGLCQNMGSGTVCVPEGGPPR
ncbi:DUF1566 domain-containing protein [Pseudodesulfovibrio sp. zrk46]|uniref:Lcl C-terminal domain-containing protein n=1 Tax=Pseudodesulfovibrio sp. zrk46 TaxID=2725288 RepID=UPI0014498F63|nr:DUF1566 domain-containing protein [Pseudodesulfovibrio sp. zrk46]QJB55869.1 DUF1566 domain-containing protein [Pseudodesulfovibrio sp. zrk46]